MLRNQGYGGQTDPGTSSKVATPFWHNNLPSLVRTASQRKYAVNPYFIGRNENTYYWSKGVKKTTTEKNTERLQEIEETGLHSVLVMKFLPQFLLIAQSDWLIFRCRKQSRQRCWCQCVRQCLFQLALRKKKYFTLILW